jgi:hypothetical protein
MEDGGYIIFDGFLCVGCFQKIIIYLNENKKMEIYHKNYK